MRVAGYGLRVTGYGLIETGCSEAKIPSSAGILVEDPVFKGDAGYLVHTLQFRLLLENLLIIESTTSQSRP